MIENIVLIIVAIVVSFYFLLSYRMIWLYKNRLRLINSDYKDFENYQGYFQMVLKFWIWDFQKLRKD